MHRDASQHMASSLISITAHGYFFIIWIPLFVQEVLPVIRLQCCALLCISRHSSSNDLVREKTPFLAGVLCRQYAERDSGSLESFWGLKVAQFWELTSALKGQHVWFQSSNKFDYVCKEEPKVMPWGLIQLMQSRCVLNVLMMEHYIRIWKATWVWVRGFQWTYSAYENVGKIYRFCFYQAHSIWVGLDALSLLPPPKH